MRLIDADAMNAELFYKQVGGKDSLITAESAFEMCINHFKRTFCRN